MQAEGSVLLGPLKKLLAKTKEKKVCAVFNTSTALLAYSSIHLSSKGFTYILRVVQRSPVMDVLEH